MNIRNLIDRAAHVAEARGGSTVELDEAAFELIVPNVFRYAIRQLVEDKDNARDFLQTHDIEISAGQGTLPESVLKEYMSVSHLPLDPTASHVPFLTDYTALIAQSLPFKFFAAEFNRFYTNSTPDDDDIVKLTAITLPTVDTDDFEADLVASDKILDLAVELLVSIMRGEIKPTDLKF